MLTGSEKVPGRPYGLLRMNKAEATRHTAHVLVGCSMQMRAAFPLIINHINNREGHATDGGFGANAVSLHALVNQVKVLGELLALQSFSQAELESSLKKKKTYRMR